MKIALIDNRMPTAMQRTLRTHEIMPFPIPPFSRLSPAIASHPDMLFFATGKKLFLHRAYYEENKFALDALFSLCAYIPVFCEGQFASPYPSEVRFNVAAFGDTLFCRTDTVFPEIAAQFSTVCNVKQGYAGCSVCAVSDNALITADEGIAAVASAQNKFRVLKIRPGHITLPGYTYGFIGGASGRDNNTVFFCGNPLQHPDGNQIREFCLANHTTPISLSDCPLADYGKIIILECS